MLDMLLFRILRFAVLFRPASLLYFNQPGSILFINRDAIRSKSPQI